MPFNHNHRYHPLLLRLVPPGTERALDVGCGAGGFARKLAARGIDVDAVDVAGEMVRLASGFGSPGPGRVDVRRADVADEELPANTYGFISCIASLHHMPFGTVAKLRDALRPGGVLAVLGLARPSTPADYAVELASAPVNVAARLVVAAGEWLNGGVEPAPQAPVNMTFPTMARLRRDSRDLLPGSTIRRLPFWRHLLTYRKPLA
ncbi:class I SAM-dependent methyltransferase [Amycolatopsis rhabdoformis]|uniref:Class I SAM-dependent methyltransferase n=1 Tax=Amycolatopsis rhabdoformis TaxID=1448059 RepID=A0ABZ1IMG4_9PSEU|nr:class I SAM-dependent methyltransferase [Amycolatopsis rhabdoformis]WSE34926.1 class I SAM-dependent methyltransferase [Amycolatopsis rhabdoformis]